MIVRWLWRNLLCSIGFHGVPEEIVEYHGARSYFTAWCPYCERLIK